MRNVNQENISSAPLTVEEYIHLELKSGKPHEFINGQLIEINKEKELYIKTAGYIV